MWPKISEAYQIYIKTLFWKTTVDVNACLIDSDNNIKKDNEKFSIEKLSKYDFEIKNINNISLYKFTCPKYFEVCNIDFYLVTLTNGKQTGIIEIIDFCVNEKHRSKRIGSRFVNILNNIALENNINYIVGELEGDNEDEPLDKRKKFYIKNGFIVKATKKSKISGFIVKKYIKGTEF